MLTESEILHLEEKVVPVMKDQMDGGITSLMKIILDDHFDNVIVSGHETLAPLFKEAKAWFDFATVYDENHGRGSMIEWRVPLDLRVKSISEKAIINNIQREVDHIIDRTHDLNRLLADLRENGILSHLL